MQPKRPLHLTVYYALPFILIVTALFSFLLFWERRNLKEEQQEYLVHTAAALVRQIVVTRMWNARHDGVYAQVDEKTPPNPYLEDPARDIVSRDGRRFTKLNPAYMMRQISELSGNDIGYRFHLTSLRPLNPANLPDPWEAKALKKIEGGAALQMAEMQDSGRPVFRYLEPLRTEEECLACHRKQGYRLGDIRGGISVTIPMAESQHLYGERARTYLAAGVGLWLSILLFILLTSYTLSRKVVREVSREIEVSRLRTAIEMAGAAAHEIRQPLTALLTYFDLLKMKLAKDPKLVKELDRMALQCRRIDGMITKMQGITEYRTKTYMNDIRIADLDPAPPKEAP